MSPSAAVGAAALSTVDGAAMDFSAGVGAAAKASVGGGAPANAGDELEAGSGGGEERSAASAITGSCMVQQYPDTQLARFQTSITAPQAGVHPRDSADACVSPRREQVL